MTNFITETRVPWLGPCKVWIGRKNSHGYGVLPDGSLVHRVTWENAKGELLGTRTLDHLCRHPACYELTHLTPRLGSPRDGWHPADGGIQKWFDMNCLISAFVACPSERLYISYEINAAPPCSRDVFFKRLRFLYSATRRRIGGVHVYQGIALTDQPYLVVTSPISRPMRKVVKPAGTVDRWASDCCKVGDGWVSSESLFRSFASWCRAGILRILSRVDFFRKLCKRFPGIRSKQRRIQRKQTHGYVNIQLVT